MLGGQLRVLALEGGVLTSQTPHFLLQFSDSGQIFFSGLTRHMAFSSLYMSVSDAINTGRFR